MKIYHHKDVLAEDVPSPAKRVKVRWLINEKTGANNFAMRQFLIQPGGSTPNHTHSWEHEVFILSGSGVILSGDGEKDVNEGDVIFVAPDEVHQFTNTGKKELNFLCLIPIKK